VAWASHPNNASTETSIRVSGNVVALWSGWGSALPATLNRLWTVSVRNRDGWPMPCASSRGHRVAVPSAGGSSAAPCLRRLGLSLAALEVLGAKARVVGQFESRA
jgi:hypothetical protein